MPPTPRPTRAEIDLNAIAHNFRAIKAAIGATKLLAVVKADAYGHGIAPVAHRLAQEGAFGFGVALAEEGFELRRAGVRSEILVLNGAYGAAHRDVLRAGLTPVVYDVEHVRAFASMATERLTVHVKVDTGMARLGVPVAEVHTFAKQCQRYSNVHVGGLMTHLACADTSEEFTQRQLARFEDARRAFADLGVHPEICHVANTAGALRFPSARYDLARVGIGLYGHPGFAPDVAQAAADAVHLVPTMRLRSEIIALRTLPVGSPVGYQNAFVCQRTTRVATVPIGYGDGLMRSNSGCGTALVRGRRCPLLGNVSMDLSAIDVTDVHNAALGDEVVLVGRQDEAEITAAEVAERNRTIPYEVLCAVSRRVPRQYR